jgi:hypothetical protein
MFLFYGDRRIRVDLIVNYINREQPTLNESYAASVDTSQLLISTCHFAIRICFTLSPIIFLVSYWLNVLLCPVSSHGGSSSRRNGNIME